MLACRYESEVTMVHVMAGGDYSPVGIDVPVDLRDWWKERVSDTQKKLESFLVDEFHGMPVMRMLLEGDPAIQIVRTAHDSGTDLIIMPTHGYGPFRRSIIGSVTAKVLHDADCPVLTGVHMEQGPTKPTIFRNILCAVDFGPQSVPALTWAERLATELEAKLTVVHVLPPVNAQQAGYFYPEWRASVERSARKGIDELLAQAGAHADVMIDMGDVSKVVRSTAESIEADLVVIGRHVDSGILGRLRAHAYAIVRESACPVVSL
jgi:nucleotide-binding universal stress UspA family protein